MFIRNCVQNLKTKKTKKRRPRFTVEKKNRKLLFSDNHKGWRRRHESTQWCISEADKLYNWNDFKKITIYTDDKSSNDNEYTYSKTTSYNRLVPNYNFHSRPQSGIDDYSKFVHEIDTAGQTDAKIKKIRWIGNLETSPVRKKAYSIGLNRKDIFDIIPTTWTNSDTIRLNYTKYIYTPDLVRKYAVLLDIEGVGFSGRVNYLLWSHRPLLLVYRTHREFFYKHLKQWVHYIPVKRDLSDLVEKAEWCFSHEKEAKEIAENACEFSELHLTREACFREWDRIICKLPKATTTDRAA